MNLLIHAFMYILYVFVRAIAEIRDRNVWETTFTVVMSVCLGGTASVWFAVWMGWLS